MIGIDFTETVIAKIIQINIIFYYNSHAVTLMGSYGICKFIFSTDTTEMDSAENLYITDFDMMGGKNLHHDKID